MNHLNEDKLIQYAFDLMEPGDKEAAQQHLEGCADCRSALDALKRKFAVMDTLTDEVPPTDGLIRKTLSMTPDSVGTAHPTNIPLYRRWWVEWSAAAAAVVIVSFLMLQSQPKKTAKSPAPEIKQEKIVAVNQDTPKQELSGPYPDDRMAALSSAEHDNRPGLRPPLLEKEGSLNSSPPYKGGVSRSDEGVVRIVSANEIPDKPPFAPASAIELVVLPKPDKTQVTIYNSKDLTLVRDTRKLTLKPGWNWLQFMWDNTQIDPTSLSLTPLEYADKVDIELISYPARLKDVGRWLIRSEVEGAVPFEITYFASGLSWRAFYMGTMNEDETVMDLKGYVNVSNNSGQDFLNTQARLIVGETRLTEEIAYLAQQPNPYGPYIMEDREKIDLNYRGDWKQFKKSIENLPMLDGMPTIDGDFDTKLYFGSGSTGFKADIKEIEKTGLSEYFLYTIEGTENLTNQWTKRLPSFDVENVPVKSLYKYDEDRYGKQPVRFVSFVNDTEHELGETPIPEGLIKIYRNLNERQNLSYIGQSNIKYIPVNEDIELNLGPARLVKVEPVLMETQTENYTYDRHGNIDGWDDIETYQVTITNTRDISVDIEITWNMGTDAWDLDLESSPPAKGEYPEGGRGFEITYKKHDKSHARFTTTVRPNSKRVFTDIIRKYRQKRIEAYVEKHKEQEK